MLSRPRRRAAVNKTLDAELAAFAERRLEEAYPYLILDARLTRRCGRGA
jgi:transposase-like protein